MAFSCAGTTAAVQGSVLVPVAADKMLATATWKAAATKGKQKPEGFLGEPADILEESLNGAAPEQAGLSITTIQTGEEPVEINTVF